MQLEDSENQSTRVANDCLIICGDHEIQVSEGGEVDLHSHYANCIKNPGHSQFIPIANLNLTHLPEDYHDNDLLKLIKSTADLTVRISVAKVSPRRPQFWPGKRLKYPFYERRDSCLPRTGSGQMAVNKYIDGRGYNGLGSELSVVSGHQLSRNYKKCPCEKCRHSDNPSKVWWEILISTATHVVFDDIEAGHTTCRLFYDDQNSPVVILDKVSIYIVNIKRDVCLLKHVTCDATLGTKLYKMMEQYYFLWERVRDTYRDKSKLTFIVSHPHGCSKQVSVGQLEESFRVREHNIKFDQTQMTYTTNTCPGSSGAKVHCLGSGTGHVHSGSLPSKLNYSSVGLYRTYERELNVLNPS
ncbi:hypothetical protein BgiMline_021440 [Biomphalaria glabrata]|uniref:Uncharacterized protein LOC129928010 n=1 Tax=Biomphalaria glabrata TaxID=6526 RepID=A0A9W3B8K5_BIOGL|nr:uncharacterized protein LOC129928010 [Biomphalaria glabrata]KAI8729365.1 hypothetical protein BgiMline_032064 [Biomphalaria glabrata]